MPGVKAADPQVGTSRNQELTDALFARFDSCRAYTRLLARVRGAAGEDLTVTGLTGSARSLVLSQLVKQVKRPLFMIVEDNQQAAAYYQELLCLSPCPVFLYPASELSPYEQVLTSADTVAGQMEVLEHIISNKDAAYVVVVPVKALLQRVLDAKALMRHTVALVVGDSIEPSALAARLAAMGYERASLVTLRGEFSLRGDIFDLFPSAGEPLRIEFFGDEIESIRLFSVDSQRSVERVDAAVMLPRWHVVLENPGKLVATLRNKMETRVRELGWQAAETLAAAMSNDLPVLEAGGYPEAAEYYAPYLDASLSTLANYVPSEALVVLDDWESLALALESYKIKLDRAYEEGLYSGRLLPLPHKLHPEAAAVIELLSTRQRLFYASFAEGGDGSSPSVIEFACHGIERFNNQMQQFAGRVRQWLKEGFKVVVSTDKPQRILGTLREWDLAGRYVAGSGEAGSTDSASILPDHGSISHDGEGVAYAHEANTVWVTREGFVGGFRLDDIRLVSVTDAELLGQKRRPYVYRRPVSERNYERFTAVADLKPGDYVVHIKQGIGQFTGLERIEVDGQSREYLALQYRGDDRLYVPVDQINLLSRYRGSGDGAPRLSRLGGAEWESTKRRVKRSVRQVAEDLVNLYALRAKQEGFTFAADTPWQYEMEEAFPWEETPDQWQAIVDVKKDMEQGKPMDRLICGDVGFGKTEVAIRAIFKCIMSGRQAAILVPTTILAQQHFNTLSERFAPYPVRVGLLSRFRTTKEQREVILKLATGGCDVVVGTHRLIQPDVTFKDLGLVIIDEEHRFGVANKEKLKQLRIMVDVMTMSATPIPRTLHMALSGARDMSLINTPPVNRAPVKTYVGEYKDAVVRTAILHEMERGGQVYFVHNRVEDIDRVAAHLKELVPEARFAIGHGQMQERELENIMLDFLAQQMDVLVCTTIIESGLDITNVNTIIIDEADKLGLAQLYQLRGRVGRSQVQAYAFCLVKPARVLTESAEGRLKAIREFTSLGSGYQIALRDMEIRGVGNILGAEQHGHMIAVGFDLYCKLLEESVTELQGRALALAADTQIDLNVTAYIPDTYIADADQKLIEYKRLADVRSQGHLNALTEEWRDRFGPYPDETDKLIAVVRLRLSAAASGISAIKPDVLGARLCIDFRLPQWLPVQAKLPKHLALRTTYRPGAAGGTGPDPYILVRMQNLAPSQQLCLLEELIDAMVACRDAKAAI